MLAIDPASLAAMQLELSAGETVVWAGQPNPKVVFRKQGDPDLFLHSALWSAMVVLFGMVGIWAWISSEGPRIFAALWMIWLIPFFAQAYDLIWGRFHRANRIKRSTFYAVTNKRVIVVRNGTEPSAWDIAFWNGPQVKVASLDIASLPELIVEKHDENIGTLRFSPAPPLWARTWKQMFEFRLDVLDLMSLRRGPVFVDIDNVDAVCQLVAALQAQIKEAEVERLLQARESSQT